MVMELFCVLILVVVIRSTHMIILHRTIHTHTHTNAYKTSAIWISSVERCQHPGGDVVLWLCKVLPLGEAGRRVQGLLCVFFFFLAISLNL